MLCPAQFFLVLLSCLSFFLAFAQKGRSRAVRFIFAMLPMILRRWDEPHLFDAICWLFEDRKAYIGDAYGELDIGDEHFAFGFPSPTTLKIGTHGSYATIEHEALTHYNRVVDPDRAESAQAISDDDPSFGGRPYWDVL